MAYLIDKDWIAASSLTGIPIGESLSIQNAGRAGDLVELILSSSVPELSDRGYAVRSIDPLYRISGQSVELWIRYIRYDLTGTITPKPLRKCTVNIMDNEQISEACALPVDIYIGEGYSKRIKTSSEDSSVAAARSGLLYSISASAYVSLGDNLALNLSLAADSVIKSASTVNGLPIALYSDHAAGNADGIFLSNNMNQLSTDESPSQGQLYEQAIPMGSLLSSGESVLPLSFITGYQKNSSILVNNNIENQDVFINIIFEEIGPREPAFGLMGSTFLQPTTEMSNYG